MAKRSNKVTEIQNYTLTKIMSMSRRDLAKAVSTLASAGNKRLARFKKAGITTPASTYIKKHGGKFSVAGKNIYELREEMQRVKGFLESKTSTITGFREFESTMSQTLYERTSEYKTVIDENGNEKRVLVKEGINYESLTETQKRRFWEAYSKLEEMDLANVYGARYRTSVEEIYTAVKGGLKKKDIDAFITDMNNRIYAERTQDYMTGENNPFNYL